MFRRLTVVGLALVTLTTLPGPALAEASDAPAGSTAQVGPLYRSWTGWHSCTASVVHSRTGNLVLTAAHCVRGNGSGIRFAPGYAHGRAPYGYWTATAAFTPSTWRTAQDVDSDMVLLKMADRSVNGVTRTIGGWRQGGCSAGVSYSPAFGPTLKELVHRAESGSDPDTLLKAGASGC